MQNSPNKDISSFLQTPLFFTIKAEIDPAKISQARDGAKKKLAEFLFRQLHSLKTRLIKAIKKIVQKTLFLPKRQVKKRKIGNKK